MPSMNQQLARIIAQRNRLAGSFGPATTPVLPKTGGPFIFDRIKETCSSPGTGAVTLLGAVAQFKSFSSKISDGSSTVYVIADQSGNNWEVQLGTYTANGNTLSRTAANVLDGSSGPGVLVNFSSGTQSVFCDEPGVILSPTNTTYNVKLFGAKGDVQTVVDGTMTAGSPVLNTLSPYFAPGDVGKPISVKGAGAAGNNAGTANYLITTILSYQSATQVTLNSNAVNSVVSAEIFWGTDDSTAINAATLAASNNGGGTVFFPAGTYFIGTAINWYTHTHLLGCGIDTTILMLKPGATCDIILSNGFASLTGSNRQAGIHSCSIKFMTINGWFAHGGFVHTQVNATFNSGATTLTVLDTSAFPTDGTLQVYDNANNRPGEVITYTGKTATTFTGCTRGVENTLAQQAVSIDSVDLRATAGLYQSGYGIRLYGYGYIIDDVRVRFCDQDGYYSEFSTATGSLLPDALEANVSNLKVHDCNGHGIWFQGPHDSAMSHLQVFKNALHGVRSGPGGLGGLQINNSHSYGQQNYAFSLEVLTCLYNTVAEQGVAGQIFIGSGAAQTQIIGCRCFATPTQIIARGIVLAGAVTYCVIDATIIDCYGGSIDFTGDGGNNYFRLQIRQRGGGNVFIGAPAATSNITVTETPGNVDGLTGENTQIAGPALFRSLQGTTQTFIARAPYTQSVNIFEAQNTAATGITVINQNGCVGIKQATPTFGLHQIGGSQKLAALGTPATPSGTPFGGSGTAVVYFIVAEDIAGNKTLPSAQVSISGGAALSATVWNRVTWTAVTGAIKYYVLKTNTATQLATVSPNIGGVVTQVAVGAGGSGYTGGAPPIGFSGPGQNMPQATATVAASAVTGITINTGALGSGFTSVPTVVIGGPGSGATATAVMGASNISSIGAGGTGYIVGDTITETGGTFTTATVFIVTSVTAGAVTGVSVQTPGSYSVLPSNPVAQGSTSGNGSGATFNILWGVSSVIVTAGGINYTSAPSIGFSGGGALPTATAILTANAVSGISVSGGLALYIGNPTVVVGGMAAGSGATATASIATLSYDDIGGSTSAFTTPLRDATADHTVDGEVILHNGLTAGNVIASGTIFSATADAVSNTNNTTVTLLGTGVGTKTLPINFFIAGRGIRIRIKGRMTSTVTTPCLLTFLVKLGSTTICTSLSVAPSTAVTSLAFEGECDIICRTVGSSGTVYGQGVCLFYNSATVTNSWGMPATAVATIDTTATQVVDFQCTQSNATNPQTLTITSGTIEVLN